MGKGSRNLHASLVVEIKLMDFRDIVTRYLAGSCNGIHEYREKKSRNYIHRLEVQRKRTVMIIESSAVRDKGG